MEKTDVIVFERKVADYASSHGLLDGGRMVVALSGGADSVALLRVCKSLQIDCLAAHCNFHLRGEESNRDEQFVTDLCSRLEVPLVKVDFDVEEYKSAHGVSTEMACRELRYDWFEQIRQQHGCTSIAVAHHSDDNVETFFLNLFRGSGISGLAAIKPRNGFVVRPLLSVGRADIEAYLSALGQDYVVDSTNLQSDFSRNKIRNILLPEISRLFPSAIAGFGRTVENLSGDYSVWGDAIASFSSEAVTKSDGVVCIDRKKLGSQSSPSTYLHAILSDYGFNSRQVCDILDSDRVGALFESVDYLAELRRDSIAVMPREAHSVTLGFTLDDMLFCPGFLKFEIVGNAPGFAFDKTGRHAYFDADAVGDEFVLRRWQQGDRFVPFGMRGSQKLSDYFSDHKYSLADKRRVWILEADGRILWIVGCRQSNDFRVTDSTRRILVVSDCRK